MNIFISREKLHAQPASGMKQTMVEALARKYYEAEQLPGAINNGGSK